MIGFLSGLVKRIKGEQAIIQVGGVGYLVYVPLREHLVVGASADLFIHTHVREDNLSLFGFASEPALNLFEKFLTVSGVGPKSALAILSAATPEEILKAITNGNLNFFTAISGIGKKGAQKIILELKPKFQKGEVDLGSLEGNSELNQALNQLGFNHHEILSILPTIDINQPLNLQIKQALQLLKT